MSAWTGMGPDKPAPRLDPQCQCICHTQPGVMHFAACCREPAMTDDTPPVLYISADTSGLTTRYKATPRMHMGAEAWVPKAELDLLRAAAANLMRVFPDPCRHDHHGYCQEHFIEAGCSVLALKSALAALPAPDEGEQDEGDG